MLFLFPLVHEEVGRHSGELFLEFSALAGLQDTDVLEWDIEHFVFFGVVFHLNIFKGYFFVDHAIDLFHLLFDAFALDALGEFSWVRW